MEANKNEVVKDESMGQNITSYIKENPDRKDVTFCVGPEKIEIKSFKFLLGMSSSVFCVMFNTNWTPDKDGTSIDLPDIKPKLFDMFLELLPLRDELTKVKYDELLVRVEEILHLVYIARKYDIPKLQQGFEELWYRKMTLENVTVMMDLAKEAFEDTLEQCGRLFLKNNFIAWMGLPEFLQMSRESLSLILDDDDLRADELALFKGLVKWAEYQCDQQGKNKTGQNIREMLGDCLFKIRFPLMMMSNFSMFVVPKRILTDREVISLYSYVTVPPMERKTCKILESFPFKTTPRQSPVSVAVLRANFVSDGPSGSEDWSEVDSDDSEYSP